MAGVGFAWAWWVNGFDLACVREDCAWLMNGTADASNSVNSVLLMCLVFLKKIEVKKGDEIKMCSTNICVVQQGERCRYVK